MSTLIIYYFSICLVHKLSLIYRNAERESYGKRLLENYAHVKKLKLSLSSAVSYHQQQAQSEDVDDSSQDKEYHRAMVKYVCSNTRIKFSN